MTYRKQIRSFSPSRIAAVLFLGFASSWLPGCDVGCSDAGCVQTLIINFSDELPAGDYRVLLTLPEGETTCDYRAGDSIGTDELDCDSASHINISAYSIEMSADPEALSVSITRLETEETVQDSFELEYKQSRPNGPKCGPVCQNATATLDTSDLAGSTGSGGTSGSGGSGGEGGDGGAGAMGGGGGAG